MADSAIESKSIGEVLLHFNQPNQLIFPEMLVSAVVGDQMHSGENGWADRYVYQWDSNMTRNSNVKVVSPIDTKNMESWIEAISAGFQLDSGNIDPLEEAIAYELEGVKSKSSARIAAVPVTVSAALLQSIQGVTGSNNPENYSALLHQIFQAGSSAVDEGPPCGELLVEAMRLSLSNNRLMSALEVSIRRGILKVIDPDIPLRSGAAVGVPKKVEDWVGPEWLSKGTPYSWFNDSWLKLPK